VSIDWGLRVGDLVTAGTLLVGVWMFSIGVVRTINGKFSGVAVTMARIDERVKAVESNTARAHQRIDTLAMEE
jgi:hypothetical protein